MKKYLLFCYHDYYPAGGMNDFQGSFDTLEEARDKAVKGPWEFDFDNLEIWDRDTAQIVWRG